MTAVVLSGLMIIAGVDGSAWDPTPEAATPATRVATVCVTDAAWCHPLPESAVPPSWARCPQWWATARAAGWPEGEMPTVDRVMWCESNCQPHAHNRSGAAGLMQIMPAHHHGRDPYDPATNLAMAKEVHDRQGWKAWSCY